jgi:molecular chaperone GrpE
MTVTIEDPAESPVSQSAPEVETGARAEATPPDGDEGAGRSEQPTAALPTAERAGDDLAGLRAAVDAGVATVLAALEERLALDRSRDALVDKLHGELQGYKSDLLGQATKHLKNGLIRLHDDLGKTLEHYRKEGVAQLTPERALALLENFQTQVEIVLDDGGVTVFREDGDRFQARRQRALRVVPTDDAALVGAIAERIRPGFEEGATLHEKERVAVYAAAPKPAAAAADSESSSAG